MHHKAYIKFCEEYKYKPFPATDWRYCQFAQFLAWQEKVPETVDNYVSTVRVLHKLQKLPVPEQGQIHYKMVSEGIKKNCKKPVKQAEPMTKQILIQLYNQVDFRSELQVVTWVAILVAFTLLLRVSNLGPRMRGLFQRSQHFLRSDFTVRNNWPTLGVRWSKTVQHRNKTSWAPLIPSNDKRICPQFWIQKMLNMIPAQPNEPLFLVRQGIHRYPLTSSQVNRLLKQWTKDAGLADVRLTSHCLCRGGLNWAHRARASGEALKLMGGWASQAYMRYLDLDFEYRTKIASRMAKC